MLTPRTRSMLGLLLAALLVPIVVAPLRGTSGPPDISGATAPPGGPRTALSVLNVSVAISPGTWTMSPGDSVNLTASWTGIALGCQMEFEWFDWTLSGASFLDGFLNQSEGPEVRVYAVTGATGPIVVAAQGTVGLACPDGTEVDSATGIAVIDLLPRLSVPALSLAPDPSVPGDLVTLRWDVAGGVGPYSIDIDFGDGTNTTLSQASP